MLIMRTWRQELSAASLSRVAVCEPASAGTASASAFSASAARACASASSATTIGRPIRKGCRSLRPRYHTRPLGHRFLLRSLQHLLLIKNTLISKHCHSVKSAASGWEAALGRMRAGGGRARRGLSREREKFSHSALDSRCGGQAAAWLGFPRRWFRRRTCQPCGRRYRRT